MPSKKKAAKDAVSTPQASTPPVSTPPAAKAPASKPKKAAPPTPAEAAEPKAAKAAKPAPPKAAAPTPKAKAAPSGAATPPPAGEASARTKAPGAAGAKAPGKAPAKAAAAKPAGATPAAGPSAARKTQDKPATPAAPPAAAAAAKGKPKPARGKAAPVEPPAQGDEDELAADLAAAGDLDDLDIDLDDEVDEDEDDDGDAGDAQAAPVAPAKGVGKGAPKAPPSRGDGGKAKASPAVPGAGKGETPGGGGGLAGLLRALGASRATPPKRPAGGADLGDDDEAVGRSDGGPATAGDEAPAAPPPPKVQRKVPPMPPRKPGVTTLAISPDADDAFMLFALENGLVATEDRKYEVVRGEVSRLNEEAQRGTYDVTAFSFGSWPQLVDRYLVLPSGASLGDGVGPVVVSKTPVRAGEVQGLKVGVPGLGTTGALVLRMWLHPARLDLVALPFEAVPLAVVAGHVRAGVLIHEAQLTYRAQGLVLVKDLGAWWTERTEGLPLPLGGMLVRRDISPEERTKINLDIKRSIAYAMGHRADALAHAGRFAKGLSPALLERYIDNYVNELSLDMGERGRQAVHTMFHEAKRQGLVREVVELEMA